MCPRLAEAKVRLLIFLFQVVFAIEQLNKITCQETATPHEQWFQMTYSGAIQGALEALQNPPDPADHRSSWEPFKQVMRSSVKFFQK